MTVKQLIEKLGEYDPSPGATGETIITYWYMVEMTTEEIKAVSYRISMMK